MDPRGTHVRKKDVVRLIEFGRICRQGPCKSPPKGVTQEIQCGVRGYHYRQGVVPQDPGTDRYLVLICTKRCPKNTKCHIEDRMNRVRRNFFLVPLVVT